MTKPPPYAVPSIRTIAANDVIGSEKTEEEAHWALLPGFEGGVYYIK
jgi:hypothetical protein